MLDESGGTKSAGAAADYEWVNAWAEQMAAAGGPPAAVPSPAAMVPHGQAQLPHPGETAGQLARDIAEIEQARDALLSRAPTAPESPRVVRIAMWSHLRRTADSVPVILGSLLGVVMLVVFSAAAAFVRLAR